MSELNRFGLIPRRIGYALINTRYPLRQWRETVLFRKVIGSRQVAVVIHEHPSEDEHLIVRNGYLRRSRREIPLPAGSADEIVPRPGTGGACADIGGVTPGSTNSML